MQSVSTSLANQIQEVKLRFFGFRRIIGHSLRLNKIRHVAKNRHVMACKSFTKNISFENKRLSAHFLFKVYSEEVEVWKEYCGHM